MCEGDNSIAYGQYIDQLLVEQCAPSVLFQKSLKISRDGDKYCVLMGENITEGIVGFGESVYKAMCDFDGAFHREIPKREVSLPS